MISEINFKNYKMKTQTPMGPPTPGGGDPMSISPTSVSEILNFYTKFEYLNSNKQEVLVGTS